MVSSIIDRNGGTSSSSPTTDRNTGLATSAATKAPCRVASVSNITLSGLQTIDGVTVAALDRVLVTGQTDTTLNGIYIVSSGVWKRSPDFSRNDDVVKGCSVRVTSGTTYSGLWVLTSADPITMGTSAITLVRDTSLTPGALIAANNLSDVASRIAAWDQLARYDSTQVIAPVATVLDLSTATSPLLDVSAGNISSVTLANGKMRVVRFTGINAITVGSSLKANNGGSNVTTAADDIGIFRGEPSSVVRLTLIRASGLPVSAQATAFADNVFRIQDNGDATKQLAWELSGITTGTTRTATPPDSNFKVAALDVAAQVVTGGARVTSNAVGTITTGTVTLDPGTRPLWDYTNGGAHTLAPGANTGSILLDITNNGSAGVITVSGWTKVVGAFDTTNAHKFRCSCTIGAAGSLLTIQAMQ